MTMDQHAQKLRAFGWDEGKSSFWCADCGHKAEGSTLSLRCRACALSRMELDNLAKDPAAFGVTDPAAAAIPKLIENIMLAVSDVMVDARVDYPAGRDCGHNIEYDEGLLKQMISFHVLAALFSRQERKQ